MGLGTKIRLSRLFSHPSGHLFGGAVDHFVGYGNVREGGLADLPGALKRVMAGEPDYVSIQPGAARHLWAGYAGKAALVIQAGCFTPDDRIRQLIASPEDAVRYGADALAVAIPVRGNTEGEYIRWLTDTVNAAARFEMPVVAHVYPRDYSNGGKIVFTPDEIAYAVRIGFETGVDVIKVGYTGDFASFQETVATCPVPIVIAGGPRADNLLAALTQTSDALRAGAKGAVVGRNLWGHGDTTMAARAFKLVIHGGMEPQEALAAAGG
ncbi:deoxyribose-phosphate aldolase/phospho-2-dehydro-3-deoxyheptonate aldolase protein (plasmid) [Rhizobium etli 8C-3]|uniref:Deoxyribose-phosphate aldolase/phospho-2-dehydro-3-deoxyheptonate aldolase protein n=2 Tax=Rhizobium TaxID=379 RepID=A0A1L5PHP3_RHIET|nr:MULTISPECIES: class I fructose-bisphosphate aldolase [Rhizobium]APO79476.1 deoxyribose-phosphate aldolase/phospho-2-dehydro-3-deoxyheptonate aldolase protein [Rhizobium etli 8C-3]TCU29429.1 class I fructose-bisphosphate aldolase [Rhizobium azibense]